MIDKDHATLWRFDPLTLYCKNIILDFDGSLDRFLKKLTFFPFTDTAAPSTLASTPSGKLMGAFLFVT